MFKKEKGSMLFFLPLLLILTGLSISIVSSNNSILTRARNARADIAESQIKEKEEIEKEEQKILEEINKASTLTTEEATETDSMYGFKYGTYKCQGGYYDGATLVINKNKTCTMTYKDGKTETSNWIPYGNSIMLETISTTGAIVEPRGDSTLVSSDQGIFTWMSK